MRRRINLRGWSRKQESAVSGCARIGVLLELDAESKDTDVLKTSANDGRLLRGHRTARGRYRSLPGVREGNKREKSEGEETSLVHDTRANDGGSGRLERRLFPRDHQAEPERLSERVFILKRIDVAEIEPVNIVPETRSKRKELPVSV